MELRQLRSLGNIDSDYYHIIEADTDIHLKDMTIHSFSVSHDANEPVAYSVYCDNNKASVITDLGYYDDYIIDNLENSDMMLVEANHDINMLQIGSYPYYLKQRILGNKMDICRMIHQQGLSILFLMITLKGYTLDI